MVLSQIDIEFAQGPPTSKLPRPSCRSKSQPESKAGSDRCGCSPMSNEARTQRTAHTRIR